MNRAIVGLLLIIFFGTAAIALYHPLNSLLPAVLTVEPFLVHPSETGRLPVSGKVFTDVYGRGLDRDLTFNLAVDVAQNRRLLNVFPIEGVFNDALIHNRVLYLGGNLVGLKVIGLSRPTKPRLLGEYLPGRSVAHIHRQGDLLFLACGRSGVAVMRIVADGRLIPLGEIRTKTAVLATRVVDDLLVAAANNGGLLTFDCRRPSACVLSERIETDGAAIDIDRYGNYIFVVSGATAVNIYRLNGAGRLAAAGKLRSASQIKDIRIVGRRLFVANTTGLASYALDEPERPRRLESYEHMGSAEKIYSDGGRLYVSDGFSRLQMIDASLTSAARSLSLPSDVRVVAAMDDFLYIAGRDKGLHVIDPHQFDNAGMLSLYNTPGATHDVFVAASWLYVADTVGGVLLKDLRFESLPFRQLSAGRAEAFYPEGNRLFVTYGEAGGVEVFDIAVPGEPKPLAQWPFLPARRVAAAGHWLFLSKGSSGVKVYDISDLEHPVLKDTLEDLQVLDLAYDKKHLYVATSSQGLLIYSVGPQGLLTYSGELSLPFPMNRFANSVALKVKEGIAYIASGHSGLLIVDIARPTEPEIISLVGIPGFAKGLSLGPDRVFVSGQDSGVNIINTKDLRSPFREAYLPIQGLARGITAVDGRIYVACHKLGIAIVPEPLRLENIEVKSSHHVRVGIPAVAAVGCYDLQTSDPSKFVWQTTLLSFDKVRN